MLPCPTLAINSGDVKLYAARWPDLEGLAMSRASALKLSQLSRQVTDLPRVYVCVMD